MQVKGTWKFPESISELKLLQQQEISGEIRILARTPAGWHAPQGGVLIRPVAHPVETPRKNRWFGFLSLS
ncbi:hypothetical protein A6M27_06480 [Acidithiobacillus thiooxidans]|uniref:Uncharacterized protein n=1 Tax=Acidithiobacillus thiooxidans TaxID=930 RepID=A0A1C2IAA6_ACITH|nr:hypothetical protein [Acidithiobacillus thiooxidans]OCX67801.1 hypothetical protein A6O24_20530 [Acidithiobacillus thiooxidans]OCX72931.1 hypothetical protein A6P07_09155 [Acidithiobacillus thiooxidans]OCX88640.1 hypothetical protein A6M27_06480 [Acidithiobacillus thiooxidans]OFC50337.1 hypothetical protein BAE47_03290 [Acidithiobacillus thiooxidans]